MHIVLLKCQIAFLQFTSCDNNPLVGCIPIAACSCSFEAEIINIGQSSHKTYSNNIVNFQESTTIFNAHTKKVWKLIVCPSYMIWFYWVLWNINHCRLFNTKFSLYSIYMICKHILLITFLNEPELIFLTFS